MYQKMLYFVVFVICFQFSKSIELFDQFVIKEKYENGKLTHCAFLKDTGTFVASAHYEATYNKTGWDVFETLTNPAVADNLQAYAAGLLEGSLTWKSIYYHHYNNFNDYCNGRTELCNKIYKFMDQNIKWVKEMIKKNADTNSEWYHIDLVYKQIKGIYDGYKFRDNVNKKRLSFRDVLMITLQYDLEEVAEALGGFDVPAKVRGTEHCSAIIKIVPGYKDIVMGHNSWNRYQSMIRTLKKYNHHYNENKFSKTLVPGVSMAFSGYPGSVSSIDDFYIMNSKLVTIETSIGNSNASLWAKVRPFGMVFESVRSVVANRLANNGQNWGKIFSLFNSGTYNNQWMIVDLTKFKPGLRPEEGLLHVLEQIPGYTVMKDQTETLIKQTYWPSYNVPFYRDVFVESGNQALVDKYGNWFSYENAPRALIFKREHVKVKDVDSLMNLLRYNNYKYDPYAKCNCTPQYNAYGAIAARSDLNPDNGTYPFPALNHRPYGAIDAKATSLELILKSQFKAVCGPSTGTNLPVFKWSSSGFNSSILHLGQPNSFDFSPVTTDWHYNTTVNRENK